MEMDSSREKRSAKRARIHSTKGENERKRKKTRSGTFQETEIASIFINSSALYDRRTEKEKGRKIFYRGKGRGKMILKDAEAVEKKGPRDNIKMATE